MAAAVFIPPSPHDPLAKMSTATRRAPLASIPNATNSPHRFLTNSGSKRSRAQANVSQQENEPPSKRQMTDRGVGEYGAVTPNRQIPTTMGEARVFERGNGTTGSVAFQRRLVAARDKTAGLRVTKAIEPSTKDDSIRQWQKHYRKIFPTFSFFFDNVSGEMHNRFMRPILGLGAKEENFFSKAVTHIITTRSIPQETDKEKTEASEVEEQLQTINPSLLDGRAGIQRRGHSATALRRDGHNHQDILHRGRQMGMKIWTVEKLQRVLANVIDDPGLHNQHTRTTSTVTRGVQEDLSQVLRNEKLGAAERDQPVATRELALFKGPFIYIHDIDEKYRPTMVREYAKVARRTDGDWPQFRSASVGKCPFVEDLAMKREAEQERSRRKAAESQQQREVQPAPRTRSTAEPQHVAKMNPPRRTSPRKALREVHNPAPPAATINPGLLSKAPSSKTDTQLSFPPMPEHRTFDFVRPPLLQMPREPAASGIQRSKLTSAIQSNMISSTAAVGVKAANSKEVNELKRRALERTNTGSLSVGSIPSSHRMNDLAGALKTARGPAPQRAAKSKAQEKLGGIQEEIDPDAEEVEAERQANAAKRKKQQQQSTQKEAKPGYCENCRDKYEDFEEHIVSRKHRKFAMTQANWTDLDALLAKLQEP